MTAGILPKPFSSFLVVGPIYGNLDKLSKIEEMEPKYDWTIFNSGLCYPHDDLGQIKNRIQKFKQWSQDKNIIYIAGRQDLLLLRQIDDLEITEWISKCCNVVIADFASRTVIVTDGGIPSTVKTRSDLFNNLELSFVSQIDDKPWHHSYNGGLGYVISNNPLTTKSPQYFNYSMQLGNQTSIYAQEVDGMGLKQTILL